MKLPQNGSALANGLLVTVGVVIGAVISFPLRWQRGHEVEVSSPGISSGTHPRSRQDAAAASGRSPLAAALAETNPNSRAELMRHAGVGAAAADVTDALRLASELASVQDRLDFSRGLFGTWADSDPAAALNYARDHFTAGELQSETIGIVINKWAADHPHEAWVWAEENLSGPLQERALTDLLIGWTRRSPEVASNWLIDSGLTSQPLVAAVARTLAESDPSKANDWANRLPQGNPRKTAKVVVIGEAAMNDPAKTATDFRPEIINDPDPVLAITLADVWGTTDPAATADWISKLPPGANRDQAAAALATIWAASDIDAAIKWSGAIQDTGMRGQVITHIGTTWGAIEPLKAIAWLDTLPPGQASEGYTGAFYSWAGTAPRDLQSWITDNASGNLADLARMSLGDVLTASDLPTSMDLALGMNSPATRDEALARFFRQWRKTDDPSAQDWLDANWSTLPSASRDRLTRELARDVGRR